MCSTILYDSQMLPQYMLKKHMCYNCKVADFIDGPFPVICLICSNL